MISGRLRECLGTLRWSQDDLANLLRCTKGEVTAWLDGREYPPLAVAAWLEALVKAHRELPAPSIFSSAARAVEPDLRETALPAKAVQRGEPRAATGRAPYARRVFAASVPSARFQSQSNLKGTSHGSHPL